MEPQKVPPPPDTWVPGCLAASSGSNSQPFFPGMGASVFSSPGGRMCASHPQVSQMHCRQRMLVLGFSSPGSLELEEAVSLGI